MRIVIDLQYCQSPDLDVRVLPDTIALVRALLQQDAPHQFWLALAAQFPDRIALLRSAFADFIAPERIALYTAPAADGTAQGNCLNELILGNFFSVLGADVVFTPGFTGGSDGWRGGGGYLRAYGILGLGSSTRAALRHRLSHADVLLAASPDVAAGLRNLGDAFARAIVEAGSDPTTAARVALATFARTVAERLPPPARGERPRLAWIVPAPPGPGTGAASLLTQLSRFYDITLIVSDEHPAASLASACQLHSHAWFADHAGQFDRLLYHIANTAAHMPVLALLAHHPGVVILHDFSLANVLDQMESDDAAPAAFVHALYASHGYSGLVEYQRNGRHAAVLKFPCNKAVLDQALGVLVASDAMRVMARQWYGPRAGMQWRVVDQDVGANPADAALQYHDAIEALSCHSAAVHYQQLLRDVAATGTPADPRDPLLLAVAKAIAENQPPKGTRQILVDISAVAAVDLKTGIQRVVRSILLALIKDPPAGFRIEPVYGNGGNRRYRYARRFTLDMIGQPGVHAEDEVIEYQSGDIFLGLDLAANSTVGNLEVLRDMRNRGIAMYFVVYDVLPLLQPYAFPFGTERYFGEYIHSIVQHADGLVCISRAVADELCDWIATHAKVRPRPLNIAHFHLGADLDASAPSVGMPDNAEHVLAAMRGRPSILMVGTLEPRKCHAQALAAFDLLWERGVDVNLVIIGKQGWMVDTLADSLRTHARRGEHLFWLPGVSDEMLTEVYRLGAALLAASTGEGFGLPLIEAAQHKVPIIARALPVFREVSGEHAFYFEGNEPAQLANAVHGWLDLFHKGQAPASAAMPWLSWSESAQQLMTAIIENHWYRTLPK